LTIFVNIAYFPFFTALQLHFEPKSHICDGLELTLYIKTAYLTWLQPRTNLYYVLVQFQHSNLTIFVNIAYFPFFTPLQLHFVPKSHPCDGLEIRLYFKTVYLKWFPPHSSLCYLLVKLWHSNSTIFLHIVDFQFFMPFSSILNDFLVKKYHFTHSVGQ